MSDIVESNRTLRRNNIKKFILRIDLLPDDLSMFEVSVDKIATNFERVEKRIIEGVKININNNQPEMNKTKDFEYVLISDSMNVSMTFSKPQHAFWFETAAYVNNNTYKETFNKIQDILYSDCSTLKAKRIGMRYVNEFPCKQPGDIKKILKVEKAKIITEMLKDEDLTRAISYKEYNRDSLKSRVQYGVANKFFPSIITTYDITLDIDVYMDLQIDVLEWNDKIKELNHRGYELFLSIMNDKYLEQLK